MLSTLHQHRFGRYERGQITSFYDQTWRTKPKQVSETWVGTRLNVTQYRNYTTSASERFQIMHLATVVEFLVSTAAQMLE